MTKLCHPWTEPTILLCRFTLLGLSTRLLLILSVLLLVTPCATADGTAHRQLLPTAKQPTPKAVVGPETSLIATVNGIEVSLERFNRLYQARALRMRLCSGEIPQAVALNLKTAIARQLIDELLLEQAAKQRGVEVLDTDADRALEQLAATFPSPKVFQRYIVTVPQGEQGLRATLRIRLLKERLAGVNRDEPVSDEDAKTFYDQHRALFNFSAHLAIQDVVFLLGADAPAEIDNAQKARAEALLDKAKQPGASFADLAQQYSKNPPGKGQFFSGRVTRESIDPALWAALSDMEPNQVSGVIKAADGYHIVKLLRRSPEIRRSFEEVKQGIKRAIQARRRSAAVGELITRLRAQAKIENHLAQRYARSISTPSSPLAIGERDGGHVVPIPMPGRLHKRLGGAVGRPSKEGGRRERNR